MIKFTFFDNLIEFLDELYELLKEDWIKFKLFMNENKKNLIWLFIALITLQITDLITFGNSCNKYYKNQNAQIQKGGSNAPTPIDRSTKPGAIQSAAEPAKQLTPVELKAQKKAESELKVAAEKKRILDKKSGKKETESEKVQQNLDLIDKIKGKKTALSKHGFAGPVFSNLEGIFGALGGIFSLFVTLLTILGVLSLPVLVFIIITYCVIKKILSHLALI